jgi:chromosome segregation ATPase
MFYERNGMKHDHIVKEQNFIYYHTPNVHIYDAVHKNAHALDALHHKVEANTKMNHEQTHLIEDNTQLIKSGLQIQTQAAQTDQMHSQLLASNAQQIGSLLNGQSQASSERNYLATQLDQALANQQNLSQSHVNTQALINQAQGQIANNGAALVQVQKNQASQAAELGTHKRDFAQYRDDFAQHNALLGEVRHEVENHDAALDQLLDAQKAHDDKQNQLIADHSQTQQMIQEHDNNLANFEQKNQAEWENQRAANAANAQHNAEQSQFIAEQKSQNNNENNHMDAQKESMKLEKVHMVAENSHHKHHHVHNHHGHAYHNVKLAQKKVEVSKPAKVLAVVLPKGSAIKEHLVKKSQYMYKGHASKSHHDGHHETRYGYRENH